MMTAAGAVGPTHEEMARTLHLPDKNADASAGELIAHLNGPDPAAEPDTDRGYTLAVANALWPLEKYPIQPDYYRTLQKQYQAHLMQLDYVGQTEPARQTINTWVQKQTNDKIKDLMPRGSITPDTRLVLTNAIYFKGLWADPFKKEQTHEVDFFLAPDKTAKVPLMSRTGRLPYLQTDDVQVLSLPYQGNALSMRVILPVSKEADALEQLEAKLDAERLAQYTAPLRPREVRTFLPRFKMEDSFDLAKTLADMGMKRAFGPGADFSGISSAEGLFLSAVVHKAFVEVNEEGTEAAAATGVAVAATAMPMQPPVFRADRPFLFLIQDESTGAILFMGRVADPR